MATLLNMRDGTEVEHDDRWWLGLRERSLEAVVVHEFMIALDFGDRRVLIVEGNATLATGPGARTIPVVSDDAGGAIRVSPGLLDLRGQMVLSAVAFKTGGLRIVFESGAQLAVPADEHYEAWQFTGSSGRTWISLPGGGLSLLPANAS